MVSLYVSQNSAEDLYYSACMQMHEYLYYMRTAAVFRPAVQNLKISNLQKEMITFEKLFTKNFSSLPSFAELNTETQK